MMLNTEFSAGLVLVCVLQGHEDTTFKVLGLGLDLLTLQLRHRNYTAILKNIAFNHLMRPKTYVLNYKLAMEGLNTGLMRN